MNRRRFLISLAGLGLTARRSALTSHLTHNPGLALAPPTGGYATEAQRLTDRLMGVFWDGRARTFRAPVRSAETVDSAPPYDNGYTLWPSLLALHALIEGERAQPGRWRARIAEVYAGIEAYFDPDGGAYNAWRHFPGNNDKYYDDNAWVVITLVEAWQATRVPAYRDRAREVMARFVGGGWDERNGGVRWGTDPVKPGTGDRTTSSTAGAALAALMLARHGIGRPTHLRFARRALDWIRDQLLDSDGLVRDGLQAGDGAMMPTKWTYNTGVPLRAWVEDYRRTGEKESLEQAKRLARAATDRGKRLYDGLVRDPERRFWYDSGFFVHYLADGLLELHRETRDAGLLAEVKRNADYAYGYLRDPSDGLYWRNWRLWTIGEAQYAAWRKLTGQEHRLEPDPSERSRERLYEEKPLTERPLVKTLLANAGYARLFWRLAQADAKAG